MLLTVTMGNSRDNYHSVIYSMDGKEDTSIGIAVSSRCLALHS